MRKCGNNLGFARVDYDRHRRCGFPEVIFGEGKTPEQTVKIAAALVKQHGYALVTRTPPATAQAIRGRWPDAKCDSAGRTFLIGKAPQHQRASPLTIVAAAGTSDLTVAEEALLSLEALGCRAEMICDIGVAGIHRLFDCLERLRQAAVIIVVAGMEGALPSVVGGLVQVPIIAVPTSVGYGASFGGLAALLTMLNACASGVAVVNIDNGFGAAAVAARIIGRRGRHASTRRAS